MMRLEDKGILLCLLFIGQLSCAPEEAWMPEIFWMVGISALCSYLEGTRFARYLALTLLAAAFCQPALVIFLPLLAYDCRRCFAPLVSWCWLLPLGRIAAMGIDWQTFLLLCLGFLAVLLEKRTTEILGGRRRLHTVEDADRERELLMEKRNRELLKRQEYEVRLAVLTERNRIAREIHDNVGHLLTRSLLQVGAMEVFYRQEKNLWEPLEGVKASLSEAMGQMRQSVHNLHEEAVDLPLQLEQLVREFTFCPVTLRCQMAGQMPTAMKYGLLAIIKEGLSNIARHSDATEAFVTLLEHPAFYRLTVSDNGAPKEVSAGKWPEGMGLLGIRERVESLGGIFRLLEEPGFGFFISIPKEGEAYENRTCG